jgi:hypothetical protein
MTMTTGINPDVSPVARRWAAELLGVPENAPGEEFRRAYFRKLRESNFQALRSLQHALCLLDGKETPGELDEEWLSEEEGRLRVEIEAFAGKFFAFPAAQRRQRWEALFSQCETAAPLAARLQSLKAGLGIEIKSLSSFQGRLAEQLLESFPLLAVAQAASRQNFLRQIEEPSAAADRPAWEKAARYLRAEWPALAALDRELVQHVGKLRSRLNQRNELHQRSRRTPRPAVPTAGRRKSPWWVLFIAVSLGSGIIRALTSSNHSAPPVPSYSVPQGDPGLLPGFQSKPIVTDPKSGAVSLQPAPHHQPTIPELLDPAKFDVELTGDGVILRFTPRPSSTASGSKSSQATHNQPLVYGKAYLTLMGVSSEQMKVLLSRAAKRPNDAAKPPPFEPAQGGTTRP